MKINICSVFFFISAVYVITGCSYSSDVANSQSKTQTDTSVDMSSNKSTINASENTKSLAIESTNKVSTSNHGLTKDFNTLTIDSESETNQTEHTSDWSWDLPKYFPKPKVPKDNPMTKAKVELGRHLFYDTRLSSNGTTSCATCHLQHLAFTDGKARSIGSTGDVHPRSSIGLANVAYMPTLNWANPAVTKLEAQLLTPMFGEMPIEMGLTDDIFREVQAKFVKDKTYQKLFFEAFGQEKAGKTFQKSEDYGLVEISQAIASFERSLISADSKFDQYMLGKVALTDSEMRGKTLFFGEKAECHHCHGSFNFNDQVIHNKSRVVPIRFHNTGIYNLDELGSYQENNEGLFEITANIEDKGKFKAPSLRNVAVTAPYNHDGSTKTLEEVVANYAKGGRIIHSNVAVKKPSTDKSINQQHFGDGRFNPNKSDLIVRINLTKQEQADIVAFLKTLTDESLLNNPAYANPWVESEERNTND